MFKPVSCCFRGGFFEILRSGDTWANLGAGLGRNITESSTLHNKHGGRPHPSVAALRTRVQSAETSQTPAHAVKDDEVGKTNISQEISDSAPVPVSSPAGIRVRVRERIQRYSDAVRDTDRRRQRRPLAVRPVPQSRFRHRRRSLPRLPSTGLCPWCTHTPSSGRYRARSRAS